MKQHKILYQYCMKVLSLIISLYSITIFATNIEQPKILFVTGRFPSPAGVAVLNQITGLIDRGCDVNILACRKGIIEGMDPDHITYDLLSKTYYVQLPENATKYDIIYAQHGFLGNNWIDFKSRMGQGTKLVVCFRGADISSTLKERPHAYDTLFKVADLFLPVCDAFKTILIKHGCDPEKITVHHSSIDCNLFAYKKRTLPSKEKIIKLISVCRLVEKKGLQYSIKAISNLIQKNYTIKYTIIGDGPLKNELQQLINDRNLQEHVFLLGTKSLIDVAKILDQSDIFVLASVTSPSGDQEGIPNSLKEAMACGLPVISTYHSGIPELIKHGESGLLIKEASPKAIGKAIQYLIDNPKHVEKMTSIARKIIEDEYDKEKLNGRLLQLFSYIHQIK